jgi:MoxR-like ATPase
MEMELETNIKQFKDVFARAKSEIENVIVGNDVVINDLLICLFAGGHALLEGVPGLGKTLLVKTLGSCFGLNFSRIQFTPDLMPSDIIGTNFVVETSEGKQFRFERGPLFSQILLADEINRATPKTQSALLEAMQELSVTVGGVHYPLKRPFAVLATQNPIEMEGTYPLPEAQLDRFLFKLLVPFPGHTELTQIIDRAATPLQGPAEKVCTAEKVEEFKPLIWSVPVASRVKDYVAQLVLATHPGNFPESESVQRFVRYGASPRGALAIVLGAKTRALLSGRFNVSFEDVQATAHSALRHRLILNFEGEAASISTDTLITEILERLPIETGVKSGAFSQLLHRSGASVGH